jgi:regulator of RNase E activity RraA
MTTENTASAPADDEVARAAKLDCASLSDALDRLKIVGQCHRIAPRDLKFRLCGRAFTVLYHPASVDGEGSVGDFLDDVPPGAVIAIDNRGREDATTWGNIMTEMAHLRGVGGTVIDGINRDVALCIELNYPIFSRGHWMRTGKGRIQLADVQVGVTIGGAAVGPGDILRGDADGVVAIPKARAAEVLAIAEDIAKIENEVRQNIRSGMRMAEARIKHKYHHLQSPAYDKKG